MPKWSPGDHPRDRTGKFARVGGGGGTWLQTLADQTDPEQRGLEMTSGDLPFGADSLGSALDEIDGPDIDMEGMDHPLAQAIAARTNYRDPKTGMIAEAIRVEPSEDEPGAVVAEYFIKDGKGKLVGQAVRILRKNRNGFEVEHERFRIEDKSLRGGGFAARWNHKMEAFYRANGVDRISLHANVDVGGYAWAKQGYDFQTVDGMISLRNHMKNKAADVRHARDVLSDYDDMVRSSGADQARGIFPDHEIAAMREIAGVPDLTPEQRAELASLSERSTLEAWEDGTAPTPLEWAMWGWTEGATDWPGKRYMLGSDWYGVKQL